MATEIHRDSGVRYLGHNLTLDDDPLKRNVDVYGREEDRAEIERFTGSITETDDTDDYVSAWYPSKPLVYSGYYYHPACPDEHEPAFFVRTSWYATPDDLKKCDMGDFSTDYLCEVLAEVDDQWGNNDYVILDEDEWASRLTAGLDTEGPKDGYTWAVYFACREGHVAVLDRLLAAAGLGVEDLRDKNNLAVRFACASGHVEVLDRLLTAGLGVEDLRSQDNWAVHRACANNHYEVLERLVVYFGSSFQKDWVQQVFSVNGDPGPAKWRQRVLVAMRVHGVLPAAGRRAAVVVQRRVREFLLAPARVFDPDAGARRRAALRLEDSYRAMASGRVH